MERFRPRSSTRPCRTSPLISVHQRRTHWTPVKIRLRPRPSPHQCLFPVNIRLCPMIHSFHVWLISSVNRTSMIRSTSTISHNRYSSRLDENRGGIAEFSFLQTFDGERCSPNEETNADRCVRILFQSDGFLEHNRIF